MRNREIGRDFRRGVLPRGVVNDLVIAGRFIGSLTMFTVPMIPEVPQFKIVTVWIIEASLACHAVAGLDLAIPPLLRAFVKTLSGGIESVQRLRTGSGPKRARG